MTKLKSIMLIDDDKDDQFFFIEALNEISNASLYGVANNGEDALTRLESSDVLPDLIFMDINMPVMNGLECMKQIMASPRLRNIPLIVLSSDTGAIELVRILGAKIFIKKTHYYKILQQEIARVVNLNFISTRLPDPIFQTTLMRMNTVL